MALIGAILGLYGLVLICDYEPRGGFYLCSCIVFFIIAFFSIKEVEKIKESKQIDTINYEVYINGQEIDRELIDIDSYEKVTYDYENERILIAID